jgi:protease I
MRKKPLDGVRVAILAADGFEHIEATWPRRALRRAGADVRIISLRPGLIRGVKLIWRGRKLPVDDTVFSAQPEDYGALYLPGGFINPDLLRQSARARAFVLRFAELGRPLAAMCHGPEMLISTGLVRGKTLTSWPGIADDLRNAGANWENRPLVRDGNWLFSRGPQDLSVFTPAMVELFAAHAARAETALPRRMRWVAQLSRLATAAALGGAFLGGRALWRRAVAR